MDFNELEWHDAVLRNIVIDRGNPGYNDTISFEVVWPDYGHGIIIFKGVYEVIAQLRFGVIPTGNSECILEAFISENDPDVERFHESWKSPAKVPLICYVLQTSTGSKIKILAESFSVGKKMSRIARLFKNVKDAG